MKLRLNPQHQQQRQQQRTATAEAPAKKPQHPLDQFIKQRIILQAGPVTYQGKLDAISNGWLVLKDATVTGNRKVATCAEVFISKNQQIQHVHLESAVLSVEVLV